MPGKVQYKDDLLLTEEGKEELRHKLPCLKSELEAKVLEGSVSRKGVVWNTVH